MIKGRLFEISIGLGGGSIMYFVRGKDCGFISKEYNSVGMRSFGETQSKAMRAYGQSRVDNFIVEIRDS